MRATDDNAEEELIYVVLKFLSLLYAIDLCDRNVAEIFTLRVCV